MGATRHGGTATLHKVVSRRLKINVIRRPSTPITVWSSRFPSEPILPIVRGLFTERYGGLQTVIAFFEIHAIKRNLRRLRYRFAKIKVLRLNNVRRKTEPKIGHRRFNCFWNPEKGKLLRNQRHIELQKQPI